MIDISSPQFKLLKSKISEKKLKLYAAKTKSVAKRYGGLVSVYCSFTGNQLFAANTLKEVAEHFKIGGDYE